MPPYEEQYDETPFLPANTGQNLTTRQPQATGYVTQSLPGTDWMSNVQDGQDQMSYAYGMPFLDGTYMNPQVQVPPPALQLKSSPIPQGLDDPSRLLPGPSRQHETSMFSNPTQHDFMDARSREHGGYSNIGRSVSPHHNLAQQSNPNFPYPSGRARHPQEGFASGSQSTPAPAPKIRKKLHPCAHCQLVLGTKSALLKHISSSHTRPFDCTLSGYGCPASFGSKNEWKRHIATKHINSGFWRCNLPGCIPVRPGDKYKDFNRKDLFMQHARRCHIPKTSSQSKEAISNLLSDSASACYNHVRDPPPTSSCGFCLAAGKTDSAVFSGPKSWDARLEHVAQHLERLEDREGSCLEDEYLRDWLVEESILVPSSTVEGQFVLKDLMAIDASDMMEE